MDANTKQLKGSPSRDAFKLWHKQQGPKTAYGLDLDFLLVEKSPPGIVAGIDFKLGRDAVSFAEVIAYNKFVALGLPLYIVESTIEFKLFTIKRYISGDWKPNPPIVRMQIVFVDGSAVDYWKWEQGLRENYRRAYHRSAGR